VDEADDVDETAGSTREVGDPLQDPFADPLP
jgi:hypothetical protein